MIRRILFLLLTTAMVLGLGLNSAVYAAPTSQDSTVPSVYIYFFWGEGCPHCATAKPFLENLADRYPEVEIRSFEVYNSPENQALFREMAAAHGFEPRYVPTIFVGEQHREILADSLLGHSEAGVLAYVE